MIENTKISWYVYFFEKSLFIPFNPYWIPSMNAFGFPNKSKKSFDPLCVFVTWRYIDPELYWSTKDVFDLTLDQQ